MTSLGTPLADILAQLIRSSGPMRLADFMALALGHPKHGYYTSRDPLGAGGDFITAPEVSQMFGELLGLWIGASWLAQGAPKPFAVVELGPGRGTLMEDALRALARVPGFQDASSLHLVETSPVLRRAQAEKLPHAQHHDTIESLPTVPLFIIANEFFDALPVRQFELNDTGWCERLVALDEKGEAAHFKIVLAPEPGFAPDDLPESCRAAAKGSVFEFSPASLAIAEELGERIATQGGAAAVIDYGHPKSAPGDTLQAVKGHEYAHPLEAPGTADLTAHVDFEQLAGAFRRGGAATHGPVDQGRFLSNLGIDMRLKALSRNADEAQKAALASQVARLTSEEGMGTLFKVLGVTAPSEAAPEGFQ